MGLFTLKRFFIISLLILSFIYGFLVCYIKIFPFAFFKKAEIGMTHILNQLEVGSRTPFGYIKVVPETDTLSKIFKSKNASDDLVLIACIDGENNPIIKIIDKDGNGIKKWNIDYEKLLKMADPVDGVDYVDDFYVSNASRIHGVKLLENGDLVFNIEDKALCKMSSKSDVLWVKKIRTHHSIELDNDGNILTCLEGPVRFDVLPNERFVDQTILKLSSEGELINQWSVSDILKKEGFQNYLLSMIGYKPLEGRGKYHLNDVEQCTFNSSNGIFSKNDLLISFCNISSIIVFDLETEKVKYHFSDKFYRQHDPDFFNDSIITFYDNYFLDPKGALYTRIFSTNLNNNEYHQVYPRNSEHFFSRTMGKHQWLRNGNLLITACHVGQIIEADINGKTQWVYTNYINQDYKGIVFEAHAIPIEIKRFYK